MNATPALVPSHTLHRRIGGGGYGEVWLARTDAGDWCAVKVVRRDAFEEARPFERELRGVRLFETLSRQHHGLVTVRAVGLGPSQEWLWYAMELADDGAGNGAGSGVSNMASGVWRMGDGGEVRRTTSGEGSQELACPEGLPHRIRGTSDPDAYSPRTLRAELRARGPRPARECLELAVPLLDALGFLHGHGLVHRDVKPSNVLFVGGRLKLSDPGLVTTLDETRSQAGTHEYAPSAGAGTAGGDLYALGKTLYELATGRPPHDVAEMPTHLSAVADRGTFLELAEIVARACEPMPGRRYVSAAAMRQDVLRVLAGESVREARLAGERAVRFQRWAVAATVSALVLGGLAAWEVRQARRIAQAEEATRRELVRSLDNNGLRAFESGELPLAALWFLKALKHARTPAEEERSRIRIASALRMTPELLHVQTNAQPVNEAVFSPDGRRLLTAGADGMARVWDADTFAPVTSPLAHGAEVNFGAFSPDGARIVTACADGRARVWDAATGELRHTLAAGASLTVAKFSPAGARIATGDDAGLVQLWHADNGRPATLPMRHADEIRTLEFSPDGRWLATGSRDATAQVWNVADGQPAGPRLRLPFDLSTPAHPGPARHIRCLAFSPDSRRLAVGGAGPVAQVWSVPGGAPAAPPIPANSAYWIGFTPDGERVVTAGGTLDAGGEARLWDARDSTPDGLPLRHGHLIRHAGLSRDGRWLATASHDGTARLWSMSKATWQLMSPALPHGDRVWTANFNPADPTRWVTAGRDGCWRVWRGPGLGEETWKFARMEVSRQARLSPDRRSLLLAFPAEVVLLHGLESSQVVRFEAGQAAGFLAAALSPDGRRVATTHEDGTARVHDARTARPLGPLLPCGEPPAFCEFSPDGRRLVVLAGTNAVVWATDDPAAVQDAPLRLPHAAVVQTAAFSHDGRHLVTGTGSRKSGPGAFTVWSLPDGHRVRAESLPMTVWRVVFSPDGRRLVVACADDTSLPGEARLWDAATWEPAGAPLRHSDGVSCMAFSPDGRRLATGTDDGDLLVWDGHTGAAQGRITRRVGGMGAVAFSADGRRLAASFAYTRTQVWDVESREPLTPPAWEPGSVAGISFVEDDRRLFIHSNYGHTRFWSLSPATNSLADLESTVTRLAGVRVVEGALVPLTAAELAGR